MPPRGHLEVTWECLEVPRVRGAPVIVGGGVRDAEYTGHPRSGNDLPRNAAEPRGAGQHSGNPSPETKDLVFWLQEEIVPTNHILLAVQCRLPFMSWVLIGFYELSVQISTMHFVFFYPPTAWLFLELLNNELIVRRIPVCVLESPTLRFLSVRGQIVSPPQMHIEGITRSTSECNCS